MLETQKLYSIKEVAEVAGYTKQNIMRICEEFKLNIQRNDKNYRVFDSQDLKIILEIRDLYKDKKEAEEIRDQLRVNYPLKFSDNKEPEPEKEKEVIDTKLIVNSLKKEISENQKDNNKALQNSLISMQNNFNDKINQLAILSREFGDYQKQIGYLEAENKGLSEKIDLIIENKDQNIFFLEKENRELKIKSTEYFQEIEKLKAKIESLQIENEKLKNLKWYQKLK